MVSLNILGTCSSYLRPPSCYPNCLKESRCLPHSPGERVRSEPGEGVKGYDGVRNVLDVEIGGEEIAVVSCEVIGSVIPSVKHPMAPALNSPDSKTRPHTVLGNCQHLPPDCCTLVPVQVMNFPHALPCQLDTLDQLDPQPKISVCL